MIAATPPFATKEPAADEAVELEEEAEVVGEAEEEAVIAPLVELAPEVLEEPLAPDRVNGIALGVALAPVALRLRGLHSADCNPTAIWESADGQFKAIQ